MLKALFTNAGRRTYIVQFALDLKAADYPLEIHVSDCSQLNAALHVVPPSRSHVLPPVLEDRETYLSALIGLVKRESFKVIFPLSDLDLLLLAEHCEEFRNQGCIVVVSSPRVVACCNDKRLTFQFCREAGLPTPPCWFNVETFEGPFPALQKHIKGSGSSGLKRIDHRADLKGFVSGCDMLQPLIEGEEFGLDVLNDLEGRFVAVCAKRKLLMRAGETDKAQIVEDERLYALGRRIAEAFRHVGNMDCDVLRDKDGRLYCIDFNPRFGGGYPATHLAGFNYLKAILDMVCGDLVLLPARPRLITVMKGISLHWCETP
ncbi:MAG: ATP-grasp domain-containing protein [Planctomycetes bacterium]|nr:ATP-grasp domain-containing protein [Planctomycetota bacterium]